MSKYIQLQAKDGHLFQAYCAEPAGAVTAAIVVVQEIFGVNSHIRSVADGYAKDGFLAISPALFDRVRPNLEFGYDPPDVNEGMRTAMQVGSETALLDVAAALNYAAEQTPSLKAGVVGFCFGGTLAWLAATRLHPAAAVGYYGGRISQNAAETPRCPVMLHFGANDAHIAPKEIDKILHHHPALPVFVYDAGHGFNCDQRKDYEPRSAALARQRTLEFLREHL